MDDRIGNGDALVTALQNLIRRMATQLNSDLTESKKTETPDDWLILQVRADTTKCWMQELCDIVGSAVEFMRPVDEE